MDNRQVLFNPTRKYRPFLQVAREAGVAVDSCLARAGLTEAQFLDPTTRVPIPRAVGLCRTLVELCGGDEIGLLAAERGTPQDHDLLAYLMKYSATPLAALRQLERYPRLIGDAAQFTVEVRAGQVTIKGRVSGGRRMLPAAADYTAATLFRWVQQMSGGMAMPREVQLPRPKPRWFQKHRRFFDVHPRYDTEWAALSYAESSLQRALPDSDPQLLAILERRADDFLHTLPAVSGVLEQIRNCLCRGLEQRDFAQDVIAERLGMSERTLRRRLEQRGTSYRELLDEVRRERALLWARDERLSVAALAERLGFDDRSAFARAFRRWTGVAPATYRLLVRNEH